mgnify:CR=1 FL=1
MALQKEIELENGVTLNYHRITSLNKITNISNNIEISSYTNENQRLKEKAYQDLQKRQANGEELTEEEQLQLNQGIDVFINTEYINLPYDEAMTIENAYDFLKSLDKYAEAIDV